MITYLKICEVEVDSKKYLSELVSELSKVKPDLTLVKSMCQKTGFNYSTDLIQLMSDILLNMNQPILNQKNKKQNIKIDKGFSHAT